MKRSGIIIITFLLTAVLPVFASEFRNARRIATPGYIPKGAIRVKHMQQLPRKQVVDAVNKLIKSWNTSGMTKMLGRDFYDRNKLHDSMNSPTKVPRDAKLKILGIGAVQTVSQYQSKKKNGQECIVSTVTVIIRTQIEFNDAIHGYQRLAGINELTLKITNKTGKQE